MIAVLYSTLLLAQKITVSGRISSSGDGQVLPGASVLIKGTTIGVMSDLNGDYKIECEPNATLLFRYTGFKVAEVIVSSQTIINVQLQEDKNVLNEVVVTALNVKREKKSLGYSVQEVKSEELNKGNNFNPLGALSGKVAGAQITQSSGDPGAATFIQLRGQTTIGL